MEEPKCILIPPCPIIIIIQHTEFFNPFPYLLLRQALGRHRHPRPALHGLPPIQTLRPQAKQLINHRRRRQRAALAIDQLGLRPRRDGDLAAERLGGGDDVGAGWGGGAGGHCGCCVCEGGGQGAADLVLKC